MTDIPGLLNAAFDATNNRFNTTLVGRPSGNTGGTSATHFDVAEIWTRVVNSSGQIRLVS